MAYRHKIRTIVVEDEEQNLNSICNKIVSLDDSFEIAGKAVNGLDALQKIEEVRPQVLFTDISMPVMGGMELIRRVRQSCPSIIIVIISGYSDFVYAQGAIKYGVFNYLLKPLENDMLLETLVDIRQNLSFAGPKSGTSHIPKIISFWRITETSFWSWRYVLEISYMIHRMKMFSGFIQSRPAVCRGVRLWRNFAGEKNGLSRMNM